MRESSRKTGIPYCCILFIICLPASLSAAHDRLIINAKVNGEIVHLAYDTGSSVALVILKPTVNKLGLHVTEENGYSVANFELELENDIEKYDAQALVIDSPPFPDIEGVIGWPALQDRIWRVQWDNMSLSQISALPNDILFWQVFNLDTLIPIAAAFLRVDSEGLRQNGDGLLYLDTGDPNGITLSDSRWNKEIAEKPDQPMTLESGYSPAAGGFYVTNVRWADRFQIGALGISCVKIHKRLSNWPNMEAMLGLEALKQFETIFDLTRYKLYLKKRPYQRESFNYNRLGAAFLPASLESDSLVGHVLESSPAYEAGLRNGDILLKIDSFDVTKWRTDPTLLKKHFFQAEAGTRYTLEIERDGEKHVITVALENLLDIPDKLTCE